MSRRGGCVSPNRCVRRSSILGPGASSEVDKLQLAPGLAAGRGQAIPVRHREHHSRPHPWTLVKPST